MAKTIEEGTVFKLSIGQVLSIVSTIIIVITAIIAFFVEFRSSELKIENLQKQEDESTKKIDAFDSKVTQVKNLLEFEMERRSKIDSSYANELRIFLERKKLLQ
ncbi:MAG TPA: hypothetical protein VKT28_19330 [Puia sp.]|nr:hypothetical protein [Puia sp.]